jgi:hypothetical protein
LSDNAMAQMADQIEYGSTDWIHLHVIN